MSTTSYRIGLRQSVLVVMVLSLLVLPAVPASADVVEVTGSAYGYFTDVSLFGGPSETRGPAPTVQLAVDASDSPQDASVESAQAVYGPAVLFESGPIDVHAEGTLGADGYVTSSSSVQGDPEGPGPLLFDAIDSTCTADEDGITTTTTITGGVVETQYDEETQEPVETEEVPVNPEPGYTVEGTIDHVGDSFRITFNQQVANPDGSVTVNAAHMELLGPTAVGEVVIGQSVCGVDAVVTTGTIAGTVTDADSSAPIEGATVTAGGRQVTTGADGSYTLAGVAPGEQDVTVQADAYDTASRTVTVEVGQTTTADFGLQLALVPGAVEGTVTDVDTGEPVEGAQVSIVDTDGAVVGSASSAGDGTYVVTGLAPGDYTVYASAFGYEPASADVTVEVGQVATVDFTLQVTPAPEGTVRAGQGSLAGTEAVEQQSFIGFPCFFEAHRTVYALQGVGTYHGWTPDGQQAVYQAEIGEGQTLYGDGPLHVEIENTESFFHGPGGTHARVDGSCDSTTIGHPVPAEVRVFAPGQVYMLDEGGVEVPCVGLGHFSRIDSAFHAEWTLSEDCTVVGNEAGTPNAGVAPVGTTHSADGISEPCFGDDHPCSDNLRIDYEQFLPFLALEVAGPVTAPVGDEVTVTARLLSRGEPVVGTDVAFAVEGAGTATPSTWTVQTDADGSASFTFSADTVGDYTVTASATHDGEALSSTHAVEFTGVALKLTGPALARVGQEVTTVATLLDASLEPIAGVDVDFTVDGDGEATPTSGTAQTDANGQASLTFTFDAHGDYTVTASAAHDEHVLSATHAVESTAFERVEGLVFPSGTSAPRTSAIDPAGAYAYFGTGGSANLPPQVVKVDLATFEYVDAITLEAGDGNLYTSAMDPTGDYLYVAGAPNEGVARVTKIDLATFESVDAFDLEGGGTPLSAAMDPAGDYIYFGTTAGGGIDSPARLVKVDLATFEQVAAITLAEGENAASSLVIDPAGDYAYIGTDTAPGQIVKVDLGAFERVDAITLPSEAERRLRSAAIDPAGDYAYFATYTNPGGLVKVDLATFELVEIIMFSGGEDAANAIVIDPAGAYAYVGTYSRPARVVQVDLATFTRRDAIAFPGSFFSGELQVSTAVIAPDGAHAYFGLATVPPGRVVKVALSPPPPGAIAGQVVDATTDTPIEGATVTAVGAEGAESSATTDADGAYTIDDLPLGDYTVTAEADLYQAGSEDVTVAFGETTTTDFALEPVPGALAGTVVNSATGVPIAGAMVTVADGDGSEAGTATANAGGSYVIEGLPPGDYEVTATAAGYRSVSMTGTVAAGQTTTLDFALQPGGGPPREPGRPDNPGPPPGRGPRR